MDLARDLSATTSPTRRDRACTRVALACLAVSAAAMLMVHLLHGELDPIHQPVSFYVHREYGGLFSLALAAFGLAGVAVALTLRQRRPEAGDAAWVGGFAAGMLLAAVVGSDEHFPWEADPSLGGVVHAAVAVVAPLCLLRPMVRDIRARLAEQRPGGSLTAWSIVYGFGLIASGCSLLVGFVRDTSPPFIGIAERVLAVAAVGWLAAAAIQLHRQPASPAGH